MLIGNVRPGSEGDPSQQPPAPSSPSSSPASSVVSFCPARCDCNISLSNQLQVVCAGHFDNDFPIGTMRKDVEVLEITPGCRRRSSDGDSEMHFDSDALGRLRREERHNVGVNLNCSNTYTEDSNKWRRLIETCKPFL